MYFCWVSTSLSTSAILHIMQTAASHSPPQYALPERKKSSVGNMGHRTELPQKMETTAPALSYLPTPHSLSPTSICLSCSPGSMDYPCVVRLVSEATVFDESIIVGVKLQLRLHHSLRERQEMVTQPLHLSSFLPQLPFMLCSGAPILSGCCMAPKGSGEGGCPMV